jgi:excisionase family DNA binding protein
MKELAIVIAGGPTKGGAMYVTSPEDRAVAWRTASSRRGEEREALRHLLASEMLVELRSDLDLYGDYGDCFVNSVDLLDRYERFFDHPMLMAYQALGVEREGEDEHEASRRLLAAVAARLGEVAASDEVEDQDRRQSGEFADVWREHLAGRQAEQYLTVAQLAARHGVTPQAVYKWIHAGKIEAEERPGGSYRIPAGQFRSSSALLARRAETRRKLRDLQGGHVLSDEEIVAALRESRRDDASH